MQIAGQDYADLASYQARLEILRRMSGAERLALALEMWKTACDVTRAGIRTQNPDFSPEQVERALAQRIMMANGAANALAARDRNSG